MLDYLLRYIRSKSGRKLVLGATVANSCDLNLRTNYFSTVARSTYSAVGEGKALFSTIAKPGMFGVGMALKENFLAYSTQFIFLIRLVPGNVVIIAIDMSPITGEWIYWITSKHVLAFTFFVYLLFVCLIIFTHFYICNVWLMLANNRISVFIFKLFLFLSLLF